MIGRVLVVDATDDSSPGRSMMRLSQAILPSRIPSPRIVAPLEPFVQSTPILFSLPLSFGGKSPGFDGKECSCVSLSIGASTPSC